MGISSSKAKEPKYLSQGRVFDRMSEPASNNTVKTLKNTVLKKMSLKELQNHRASVRKQMQGPMFGTGKKVPSGYLQSLNNIIKKKQLNLANQAEERLIKAKIAGRLA